MKLLWVLLALAAVAAPITFTDAKAAPAQDANVSDWREKAIELLQKSIARLEAAIERLPEGSKLRPYLNRALDFLRQKLTDLQDAAVGFTDVNRLGFLQRILDRLEEALQRLPEGPLRDRLQQQIDRIRELLESLRPDDAIVVTDRIRELLQRIRRLIDQYREAGEEALLRFLNSDRLEALVSRLPEPIQSEVRERIDALRDRLETSSLSVSDWREKAVELLQRAIARLEAAIERLPEGSRLRPYLNRALDFLRRKLTDLQDAAVSFGEADRIDFLQGLLDRMERALERLPEGPLRDRLQQQVDRIRELLESLRPDDAIVVTDRIRELLQRIRRLIDQYREAGEEALLRFLNSDRLEELVSRLPEPIQSEVRERIDALRDRLENSSLSVSDWREKAVELLQRAIARLEAAIERLPEGSRLRPYLNKALDFLRRKLTDLQDAAVSFGEADRIDFLQGLLDRMESALERLPEGPLRDRLQQQVDRIRELLNSLRPDDAIVVNDRIRELLQRIRRLIDQYKEAGKEALLRFLNSDRLEELVSRLPEPIQSEVRERIAGLKDRLQQ